MRCINKCVEPAERNFTWPTTRGAMSANLCGSCAATWWSRYANTDAGLALTIGEPKTDAELAELCAEYSKGSGT